MSLFGLLNTAQDTLAAQSSGLNTTGQNVANVNTPGYTRRMANLETAAVDGNGQGAVFASGVIRTVDQFANARVVQARGRQGAANARADALGQLESVVAPGTNGISDRVASFFSSLQDLSASPSDPSARATVLSRATDLATTVSSTAGDIARAQGGLLSQAQTTATEINDRLTRIAGLNQRISQALGQGSDASDLLDQRDSLVAEVADRVGGRAVPTDNGQVMLYAAGVALVDGNHASTLAVTPGPGPASPMVITAQVGGSTVDVTAAVTDGSLGGLREARDVDMAGTATALDQFASDLSTAVNTAHAGGVGLDGVTGRNLFAPHAGVAGTAAAMAVDPALAGHPDRIAASGTAAGLPGGNTVALQLAGLASTALTPGTGTPGERVATISATVGIARSSAESERTLRQDTVTQATNLQQSASGVSLDEEMINMTRFQRAYEAGTKVLQTADQLLDGLMQVL